VISQGQEAAGASGDYNVQHFTGVLEGEPRSKAREFILDPRTKQVFEQDGQGGWKPVNKTVTRIPDQPQTVNIVTPDYQGIGNKGTGVVRPWVDANGNVILPPPTAGMREKETAKSAAVNSIGAIKSLGDNLITKIGPAQRADAAKRGVAAVFGKDPEFRTYQDSRLALAGNLAVLQQGSRPSDADIKAIWLPMIPDVYSDTAQSNALKWRMIQVMSGVDPQAVADAAAAFAAGSSGASGPGTGNAPGARTGGAGPGGAAPPPGGRTGRNVAPGGTNAGAAATRLKVRQYLQSKGKLADEASINVFLQNEQNANFIRSWNPAATAGGN
jgi:hypothetical protein